MTASPSQPSPPGRGWLAWLIGGCIVLTICVILACLVGAAAWLIPARRTSAAPPPPSVEVAPADSTSLSGGSIAQGELLFNGEAGCSACHSLQPGVQIVGPSLSGIAVRAAAYAADSPPGTTAEQYLLQSITDPDAYVVEGFRSSIMPANYGQHFSRQQLADLVAFLMTK